MTADELLAVIRQVLRQRFAVLAHELTPAMIAAFRARGLDIVEKLKLTTDLRGMVDKRAAVYASERAGELIKDLADATPEMLRATVATALEERWSGGRLRDALREDYAFSPERALTIARTETAIARRAGGQAAAVDAGLEEKRWEIADDDACELCIANEDAGWIAIGETFPNGDNPHPNCVCRGGSYRFKPRADDDLADAA